MNPAIFIAHVLAFHLSVPEPVHFNLVQFPFEGTEAQINLVNGEWYISYDEDYWREHSDARKKFVLAHELCHTIYMDPSGWNNLSKKELNSKQERADACARKIMREHKRCER